MSPTTLGYWSVIGSYVCWGFMPLYTRQFTDVSLLEFFVHRIIWAAAVLSALMLWQGKLLHLLRNLSLKRVRLYSLSAFLVGSNWYLFVWGIMRGDITEASLGYFINPLVSVVLGLIILREKLRNFQYLAVIVVVLGVSFLGFAYGKFPWLALALGGSFGLYGLIRKLGDLNAVEGLTLEMLLLLPFVLPVFFYLQADQQLIFGTQGWLIDLKMISTGIVTAVPMLIFIFGVQRISMTSLGIIQYFGPTLQFLSGIIIFHEVVNQERLMGFAIVWLGCLIFAFEGIYQAKRNQLIKAAPVIIN